MLWLCAASAVLEFFLYIPIIWRAKRLLAPFILIITTFGSAALAIAYPSFFTAFLLCISLVRAFNMIRITQGRIHDHYMRVVTRRTSFVLIIMQIVTSLLWALWHYQHVPAAILWACVAGAQVLGASVLLATTIRRLRRTAWRTTEHHYSDSELPTVTVAVPARNETEALQQCLASVIASDYPKLEVIVLDDCSQTRRTPEIIREFAHDGVRFVPGNEPSDIWLPKNLAYDRLADEASGDYLLFCGVDITFEPGAIRAIISDMLSRKKAMLSLLPDRRQSARRHFSPAQAIRYFWELVPPRRLFGKPPVLSSCWVITKAALHHAGGFEAVRRAIVPEAYFARQLSAHDEYSFMRAGSSLGIISDKTTADQHETAVRVRYPQLHRRPESVFIIASVEITFLLLPFVVVVGGSRLGSSVIAVVLAAITSVLLVINNLLVVRATNIGSTMTGLLSLPVIVIYDLIIMFYSMWRYEFLTVDWKGRNICVPAMHVIPQLPKINE
jgi:glycosyltransferase involved in cell wall biosynthesis